MKRTWIGSAVVVLLTVFYGKPGYTSPWQFVPYAGIDANYRYLPFEDSFGDDHFQKHYFEPSVNVGLMVHQYFGFEAGFGEALKRHKDTLYSQNSFVLGFDLPFYIFEDQMHLATSHMQTGYLTFVGQYPFGDMITVFGQIGAAVNRLELRTQAIGKLTDFNAPVEWQTSRKFVPRVAVGVKKMLTKCVGARAIASWQRTSRFNATVPAFPTVAPPLTPSEHFTVKAKNGGTVGVGLFYQHPVA